MGAERPNYCPECGTETPSTGDFCTNCGAKIQVSQQSVERSQRSRSERPEPNTDAENTFYTLSVVAGLGWLVFVVLGYQQSSPTLSGVALLCLLVSVFFMYFDLKEIGFTLRDTPPWMWVIACFLLYIVAFPYYAYARKGATDTKGESTVSLN
jgi:hypothetical protein